MSFTAIIRYGFITFFVGLSACYTGSEAKIIGIYKADAPCANISLAVHADHSFTQSVRTKEGEVKQLGGEWDLDPQTKYVTFKPFLDFVHENRGAEIAMASFPPEVMGLAIEMGPVIIKCSDSSYEVNYTK